MEKSFTESLNMKGHLTISKVKDGTEEIIFDEKNVIVSGFGVGLGYLFSKLGSTDISDYQIDRFQLGLNGSTGNQVSSTFQLSSPLSSQTEYVGLTSDSNLLVFSSFQIKNGVSVTSTPWFGKIPFTKVTKIDDRSVRYTIFVDEDSCNNITRNGTAAPLNEIGLFMKNPMGVSPEACILVAYKYFSNVIKTEEFGLIFRWTISFG